MRSGGGSAGSSRSLRLDPFALPVAYVASDAAADGRVRQIELFHERVVMRRSLAGMHMAFNVPLSAFAGVAVRLVPGVDGEEATVEVVLEHKDPGLTLPVYVSSNGDDVLAEWHSWSRALGLPLLVTDDVGWRDAFARMGGVLISPPRARRRRHSSLKRRRPSILMRRKPGKVSAATQVHRGECEIIARN